MTRSDICDSDDYETRDRLARVLAQLGGRFEGADEAALGVGLTEVSFGSGVLTFFIDAWSVDVHGPPMLVSQVLEALRECEP